MKKLTTLALAVFGLILGSYAFAQNSATTSANATARIVTPITLTKTSDMNFGDVVPSGVAGTVQLSPAGARVAGGGAALGSAAGVAAAGFTVAGQANYNYSITLPASTTVNDGGPNNMTVNAFTSNPTPTGNLGAGGSQALLVGATLNVGANQVTGVYTGTFNVTVTYN